VDVVADQEDADALRAEVRVRWRDGESGPWIDIGDEPFVWIERGASEALPWSP